MLTILQDWIVDPDHRQDRGNGPVKTRKMTRKEWKKYGPVNTKLKRSGGYKIQPKDIESVLKRRGLKRKAKV